MDVVGDRSSINAMDVEGFAGSDDNATEVQNQEFADNETGVDDDDINSHSAVLNAVNGSNDKLAKIITLLEGKRQADIIVLNALNAATENLDKLLKHIEEMNIGITDIVKTSKNVMQSTTMVEALVCQEFGPIDEENMTYKVKRNEINTLFPANTKVKVERCEDDVGLYKQVKNTEKILVELSDDEDEPTAKDPVLPPMKEAVPHDKEINQTAPAKPKEQQGEKIPVKQGKKSKVTKQKTTKVGKRLFPTPNKPSKIAKVEETMKTPDEGGSGSKPIKSSLGEKQSSPYTPSPSQYSRNSTSWLKGIKTSFTPPPQVQLTRDEVQVFVYIFSPHKDTSEVLMKVSNTFAWRRDLECLCPGRTVETQIFDLLATKMTWEHVNIGCQLVWCLPSSFAVDVLVDIPSSKLVTKFCTSWMKPFSTLKYIYAPIQEDCEHWYLMVVSLQHQIIYYLDSYIKPGRGIQRRVNLRKMCKALVEIIAIEYPHFSFAHSPVGMESWDICNGKGIPNCGNSDNSAIWVMDWMHMDLAFTPNLSSKLDEKAVRMRTAVELVMGAHNELKKTIEAKAEEYWHSVSP